MTLQRAVYISLRSLLNCIVRMISSLLVIRFSNKLGETVFIWIIKIFIYVSQDFVDVIVAHEFEDEENSCLSTANWFLNNGLNTHNSEFEVSAFIKLGQIGYLQNGVQKSEKQFIMLMFHQFRKYDFKFLLIIKQTLIRSTNIGWNVLNVRTHNRNVFFCPIVGI